MLDWFGRRLRYIQEVKREERGFTLIELLVVVIIIGILAAIAIPAFLSQRTRAQEGAAKSDLRNMAASATSCYSSNNGSYAAPKDCHAKAVLVTDFGFKQSTGVVTNPTGTGADVWTATSKHDLAPTTFTFSTETGKISP